MKVLKSIGAVLAGIVLTGLLTAGTDTLIQYLGIMTLDPIDANPTWVFVLAVLYRIKFYALGGYLAARLAPNKPMRHALIVGAIGFIITAIGTVMYWGVGPAWYPIAVTLIALPGTWLGGWFRVKK